MVRNPGEDQCILMWNNVESGSREAFTDISKKEKEFLDISFN